MEDWKAAHMRPSTFCERVGGTVWLLRCHHSSDEVGELVDSSDYSIACLSSQGRQSN